jgi:hypothetical protein
MKMSLPAALVGCLLALALAAWVVGLLLPRSGQVSITLVKFTRWPHGAMLQLPNGTRNTIRHLAERDFVALRPPSTTGN